MVQSIHGTIYKMTVFGCLLDYIDSIFPNSDQNHYKILCIIRSHIVHYKIFGDLSFSKHHLVSLLINLSNSPLGGSSWNANASFLQDVKDPIKALREAAPSLMSFLSNLVK